ncbi:MAG: sulfite exporter TauE/SafE family protein [Nitrosomonadales bacterium]
MLLIPISLGLLIGLLLALTGAGGGILAVPALTLGLGWTMSAASPIALLTVATAAAIGMVSGLIAGAVRIRAALLISAAGILAAPLGQQLAHRLPERWLTALFVCVMLIVAARLFQSAHPSSKNATRARTCVIDTKTGRISWNALSFLKLSLIGLVSGLSTGLLGVGGGFIVVPALLRCSDIAMNGIIATSLTVITFVSLGAVISAFSAGHLNLTEPALLFIAAAATGMLLGRLFAPKIPAALLQKTLALLILSVALFLLYRTR